MQRTPDTDGYSLMDPLETQVIFDTEHAHLICCEDGRLLGSNVPSVNIYISAATVKVCVSVPLTPHDPGMYSHTYIPPSNTTQIVLHPPLCRCGII